MPKKGSCGGLEERKRRDLMEKLPPGHALLIQKLRLI